MRTGPDAVRADLGSLDLFFAPAWTLERRKVTQVAEEHRKVPVVFAVAASADAQRLGSPGFPLSHGRNHAKLRAGNASRMAYFTEIYVNVR
jgi:hypothetical protein